MQIEIKVVSRSELCNISINEEAEKFVYNGININCNIKEFAQKLFDIVIYWDENMVVPNIIDAESYSVKIIKNGKEYNFAGKGKYPKNYVEFKSLLKQINLS